MPLEIGPLLILQELEKEVGLTRAEKCNKCGEGVRILEIPVEVYWQA